MRQVGNGSDGDDGMGEEEEEAGGPAVEVQDMAAATFTGHSDAVYGVAVNPKNPSQVQQYPWPSHGRVSPLQESEAEVSKKL